MSTLADYLEPTILPPLAWLASPYPFELQDRKYRGLEWRLVRWISSGRYSWMSSDAIAEKALWIALPANDDRQGKTSSIVIADQFQAGELHREAVMEVMSLYDMVGDELALLCHTQQSAVWAALQGKRGLTDAMTYVANLLFQGVDPASFFGYPAEPDPGGKNRPLQAFKPRPRPAPLNMRPVKMMQSKASDFLASCVRKSNVGTSPNRTFDPS